MGTRRKLVQLDAQKAGDTFRYHGVPVTVLRDVEPRQDIFGRDMLGLWCRREDTGAEGFIIFGPGGITRQD